MVFAWEKLKDARGNRFRVCQIIPACKLSGYERRFLIQRGDTASFGLSTLVIWLMCASIIGVIGIVVWFWGFRGVPINIRLDEDWVLVFIVMMSCYCVCMGFFMSLYVWKSKEHAIRAMTRAGLCPSCVYRIDEIESEADGCVVCPECGGAWRVSGE